MVGSRPWAALSCTDGGAASSSSEAGCAPDSRAIRKVVSRGSDRRRSLRGAQKDAGRLGRARSAPVEQTRSTVTDPAAKQRGTAEQRARRDVGSGTQISRTSPHAGAQSWRALGLVQRRCDARRAMAVHEAAQSGRESMRNQRKMQAPRDLQQQDQPRQEGAKRLGCVLRPVHREGPDKYRARGRLANRSRRLAKRPYGKCRQITRFAARERN